MSADDGQQGRRDAKEVHFGSDGGEVEETNGDLCLTKNYREKLLFYNRVKTFDRCEIRLATSQVFSGGRKLATAVPVSTDLPLNRDVVPRGQPQLTIRFDGDFPPPSA